MDRVYEDVFGYQVKFVKGKHFLRNKLFRECHYVYLNEVFVGICVVRAPGNLFWAVTPSGQYNCHSDSMIGCVRCYIWDCLVLSSASSGGDE